MSKSSIKNTNVLPPKRLSSEDNNLVSTKIIKSEYDMLPLKRSIQANFNADPLDDDFLTGQMKFEELSNAITNFSFRQFLEFLIYHLLFFLLLGPIFTFFLFLLKRNTILARNLGFWGSSQYFYKQTCVFFMNFISIFGFMYLKPKTIHQVEVMGLLGSSLIRSFVISTKYAYFSAKMCEFYKKKLLSEEDKASELIMFWGKQDDKTIEREFSNTMKRNYIDASLFKFFFLKPLRDDILDQLTRKNNNVSNDFQNSGDNLNSNNKKTVDVIKEKKKNTKQYKNNETVKNAETYKNGLDVENPSNNPCFDLEYEGTIIAKYLIKKSKNNGFLANHLMMVSFFLSLLRAIIPTIYRYFETGSVIAETKGENIIILFFLMGNLYFFTVNFMFIIHGIVEYQRLLQLLSQLTNLISLAPVEKYKVVKDFPTINVFCNVSFGSWYSLNKLFRDYGKRFFNRIDIHLGIFIVYYLIMALLTVFEIYDIISPLDYLMVIICGYEMFLMFLALLGLIWKGVVINDHYTIHRELLNTLKDLVNKFLLYGDFYFERKDFEPEDEIFAFGKMVLNEKLKGSGEDMKTTREDYLQKLLDINDFVQGQLTYDEDKKPFKVLGVKADKPLFQKIIAGLGSIATAAGQKLMTLIQT